MTDRSEHECFVCMSPMAFLGIWVLPPEEGVIGGIGYKEWEPIGYHECEKCGLTMKERGTNVEARFHQGIGRC